MNNNDKQAGINHQYTADDEIDLFELAEGLIAEKVTIISIFLIVTLLAGLYAFLSPKTYEVNASFLPPLKKDVVVLNYPDVLEIDENRAYRQFIEVISSPDLADHLLREPAVMEKFSSTDAESANIAKNIMNNVSISLPAEGRQRLLTGDSLLTRLTVNWSSAEDALLLATSIIEVANKNAKDVFLEDLTRILDDMLVVNHKQFETANQHVNQELNAEISFLQEENLEQKKVISEEIQLLRVKAAQQRNFEISRLEADFSLAKQLGIKRPIDPLDYQRELVATTTIDLSNRTPSRYWLGTEILEAEIQALKSRTSDDPYIDGLAELQKKLAALENNHRIDTLKARTDNLPFSEILRDLKKMESELLQAQQRVQTADFEVVRMAQTPALPTHPIKPKKMMILALGSVAGGMIGVMVGLIKRAITNRRKLVTA